MIRSTRAASYDSKIRITHDVADQCERQNMVCNVYVVIVTYNRKSLLSRCLNAIQAQTFLPKKVVIVNNNSGDGTDQYLEELVRNKPNFFHVLNLPYNIGGAGGFSEGLRIAVEDGADWIWMMDDDAVPMVNALEVLFSLELNPRNIYGSVAHMGENLSWLMKSIDHNFIMEKLSDLHGIMSVEFIPFLGILVSSQLVSYIGYPDSKFFIAVDDVEYCMRARKYGSKIMLVGNSRIEHPISNRYKFWFINCLRLPPWKRYYDVRNRIFVAKKYYGFALWYKTIPGSILRLIGSLLYESNRLDQIRAFFAGMVDGLMSRGGCRHKKWGLE